MAITPELLEYIKRSLSAGASEQDIKATLASQGWVEADITAGFSQAKASVSPVVETSTATNAQQVNNLPEISKKTSGKRNMIITVVAVVVALLLVGTAAAFFMMPVKPEAMVNQAFSKMMVIDSMTIQAKVTGDVTTPDLISSALFKDLAIKDATQGTVAGTQKSKFDLQFNGSVDTSVPLQTKAKGSLGLEVQNYKLAADYLSTNEGDFFVKLTEAPVVPYFDLDLIKNMWIKLFTKQDLQKMYEKNKIKQERLSEEQLKKMKQVFKDNNPFIITEKLADETINSQSAYHYKYHVDMVKLEKLGNEINNIVSDKKYYGTDESFQKEVQIPDGEIWIGKKDKYLYKMTGGLVYDTETPKLMSSESGEVKWEVQFSDFNKKLDITAPAGFKTLQEVQRVFLPRVMPGTENIYGFQEENIGRDAQRMADINSIKFGIGLYYSENGKYPNNLSEISKYFPSSIPSAPTPPDGSCTEQQNQYTYRLDPNKLNQYTLTFCLGSGMWPYSDGVNTIDSTDIE